MPVQKSMFFSLPNDVLYEPDNYFYRIQIQKAKYEREQIKQLELQTLHCLELDYTEIS